MNTHNREMHSPEAQPTGSDTEHLSSSAQGFYLVVGVVLGMLVSQWLLEPLARVYERLP